MCLRTAMPLCSILVLYDEYFCSLLMYPYDDTSNTLRIVGGCYCLGRAAIATPQHSLTDERCQARLTCSQVSPDHIY